MSLEFSSLVNENAQLVDISTGIPGEAFVKRENLRNWRGRIPRTDYEAGHQAGQWQSAARTAQGIVRDEQFW